MKWFILFTILLFVVIKGQCAPMMEGCWKRWNGCPTPEIKEKQQPQVKTDDVPKDMARFYLKKLIESKDFLNKFRNKQSQGTSPLNYDMGRIARKFKISLQQHQT